MWFTMFKLSGTLVSILLLVFDFLLQKKPEKTFSYYAKIGYDRIDLRRTRLINVAGR